MLHWRIIATRSQVFYAALGSLGKAGGNLREITESKSQSVTMRSINGLPQQPRWQITANLKQHQPQS